MKLEELYPNYNEMTQEERFAFVAGYRFKRASDLSRTEEPSAKKQGLLVLTEEEKVLMKLLGIKQKDIKALRALQGEEPPSEETPEDDAVLFDDDNLTLEAEE